MWKTKILINGSAFTFCCGMMTSCSVTAPDSRIGDVSDLAAARWSASEASKAGIDHDWVGSFGDRELSRLVNIALTSAPEMTVAYERVVQARENASISGAALKPTMDFTANLGRRKSTFLGVESSSFTTASYDPSFSVNWEPDIWGSKRAGLSAAVGEFQAVEYELRGSQALLAAQVCTAWFLLAEANEQMNLAKEALKLRKETSEAIQLRFEQNLAAEGGSSTQLRLAQIEIATAKAALAQRNGEKEAASRQLEILLGRYPSAKINGNRSIPRLSKRAPVGLPSELLLRRPDILASERRYAAVGKSVIEAKYAIYPSFPLTASMGTSSSQLKNVLNSNFGVWSLGAAVVQPILTGGAAKAEQLRRKSVERQALASLQGVVINAFGEVESALASEKWLVRRINEFNEALRLAEEASNSAKDDYVAGTGDMLTLLNAQNSRIQIASQIATLRRLRCQARVELHLALGGGFKLSKNK